MKQRSSTPNRRAKEVTPSHDNYQLTILLFLYARTYVRLSFFLPFLFYFFHFFHFFRFFLSFNVRSIWVAGVCVVLVLCIIHMYPVRWHGTALSTLLTASPVQQCSISAVSYYVRLPEVIPPSSLRAHLASCLGVISLRSLAFILKINVSCY